MITGKPPDITMLQRIGIAQEYGLVDYPNATVPMSIWLSVDESFMPNLWEVDVKSEAVYTENLAKETKVTA
ncbi:hypothetical protein RYX36_036111 [Vicia faba]